MPLLAAEKGWSEAEMTSMGSLLMGLFYAGYGVANIFLTPFATRAGPRRSLIVIILLWSLFTVLGAVLSQFMMLFMASRVLLGFSEGVHTPMMNQLTNRWFAANERSRANSVWVAGLFLAILSAPLVLVPIMDTWGWRTGFYVLAVGGIVISLPLVSRFVYDRPDKHPRLSPEYATELAAHAGGDPSAGGPAWALLREKPYLVLIAGGILNNMVALGIASWLPTWMAGLDGVAYGDLAYLASAPYAASLLGLVLWANVGDRLNRRAWLAAAGYTISGVIAVIAFRAGEGGLVIPAVILLSCSVFFNSAYVASEFALVQRVIPGTQVGNGIGLYSGMTMLLGGGLGPFVVGGIINGGAAPEDLAILFGLCVAISATLVIFGRRVRY